ncbi:NADH:ubiquinone oxidoreductase subunit 6 (subunit J) [Clostridium beijerinckii]|nr:NADH:ubiquinone oxidoreductase subunit 6 (subunit J) [Clostridium beijerinckii]
MISAFVFWPIAFLIIAFAIGVVHSKILSIVLYQ